MNYRKGNRCSKARYGCIGRLRVEEANGRKVLICKRCRQGHGLHKPEGKTLDGAST
jgi:hypothetical protein